MRMPWSKPKKTEHEIELEKLEKERALKDAKLKAAEVDDDVIRAAKINKLFKTITAGSRNLEEVNQKLRMFAEHSGMNFDYLKAQFAFDDSLAKVDKMDDKTFEKLERMAKLAKEQKKMLGYKK